MSLILCTILLSLVSGQFKAISSTASNTCAGAPGVSVIFNDKHCRPVRCVQDTSSRDDLKFVEIECASDWESYVKTKFASAPAPVIVQQLFLHRGCDGEPNQILARVSGVCHASVKYTLQNDGSILIETWRPSVLSCAGAPVASRTISKDLVNGQCHIISKYSIINTSQGITM